MHVEQEFRRRAALLTVIRAEEEGFSDAARTNVDKKER
jgi:hypothetical protein